ncbi:MAG: hypothetical protein JXJ22_06815 [Bacteroidales bacterium]|nr:hypothetical protein [Bacteroidales bacterium]
MKWYDIMGNLGVLFIVATYLLLQINKISGKDLMFSLLNALGAVLILISLFVNFNLSAFLIEIFWLLISIYGIIKYLRKN